MINTLLDHLEKHKGNQGLYMTDRQQAAKDAVSHLAQLYPRQRISVTRLLHKLNYLWQRHRRPEYALQQKEIFFQDGRRALGPELDASMLLLQGHNDQDSMPTENISKPQSALASKSQQSSKRRGKRRRGRKHVSKPTPSKEQQVSIATSYPLAMNQKRSLSTGGLNQCVCLLKRKQGS